MKQERLVKLTENSFATYRANGSHGGVVEKLLDDFVSSTSNQTKVGSRLWKTSTVSRTSQLSVKCGWKKIERRVRFCLIPKTCEGQWSRILGKN